MSRNNKLFLLALAVAGALLFLVSCDDEDDPMSPTVITELDTAYVFQFIDRVEAEARELYREYCRDGEQVRMGSLEGHWARITVALPELAPLSCG